MSAPGKGTAGAGVIVGAVELIGYYRYDSGNSYRVWRLLEAAPHVPASLSWRDDVSGPPHAAAGDLLREDREDRGQVFRLERDELVIGRPEWWQLGDLFGGTWPAWTPNVKPAEPEPDPPRLRLARLDRDDSFVWQVLDDLPECPIRAWTGTSPGHVRAGDLLHESPGRGRISWLDVDRDGARIGYLDTHAIAGPLRESFSGGGLFEDFPRKEAEEADGVVLLRVARDTRIGSIAAPAGSFLARSNLGFWTLDARLGDVAASEKVRRIDYRDAGNAILRHQAETEPEARAALALILPGPDGTTPSNVWRLERDVPGSDLRAGDVLVKRRGGRALRTRGTCRPLSVADLEALRAVLDAGGYNVSLPAQDLVPCWHPGGDLTEYIANRNKWGLRRKVWAPDWFVVRPVAERPAVSIDARSDVEALFELLSLVGCKMPSKAGEP